LQHLIESGELQIRFELDQIEPALQRQLDRFSGKGGGYKKGGLHRPKGKGKKLPPGAGKPRDRTKEVRLFKNTIIPSFGKMNELEIQKIWEIGKIEVIR
jgi:hypothetical protein